MGSIFIHICDMTQPCVPWLIPWNYTADKRLVLLEDIGHHGIDLLPCVWHDAIMCVVWLIRWIYTADKRLGLLDGIGQYGIDLHSYAWHDAIMCVIWLISWNDLADMILVLPEGFGQYGIDLHSYVWYDAIMCVIWLVCDMTRSLKFDSRHDTGTPRGFWAIWDWSSFIRVIWCNHVCDMTCVWCDSFLEIR